MSTASPMRDEMATLATADPSKMSDEELRDYIARLSPKKKAELSRRVDRRMSEERRVWFCGDRQCDGKPHGAYNYPHARGSQRQDQRGSQYPPLGADWYTWLLGAGRGAGKALDVDTPIRTAHRTGDNRTELRRGCRSRTAERRRDVVLDPGHLGVERQIGGRDLSSHGDLRA